MSVYPAEESEGIGVEYPNGHGKISDDDYTGRLLKAGTATVDA